MNLVVFSGRLTKEPVIAKNANNNSVLKNGLAVKRDFKDAQGNYGVDFINFNAFGKTAETIAQFCSKGDEITIQGTMRVSDYEGKTYYVAMVDKFDFGQKKKEEQPTQAPAPSFNFTSEDLPF